MEKPTTKEIFQKVLAQLTERRIPPTPENYTALYHEIAGTSLETAFPEQPLKALATALPRDSAEQKRLVRDIEAAVAKKNWEGLSTALTTFSTEAAAAPPAWSTLVRDLVQQLERNQVGLTPSMKRTQIQQLLQRATTPEQVLKNMQSLVNRWSQSKTGDSTVQLVDEIAPAPDQAGSQKPTASAAAPAAAVKAPLIDNELQNLIALLLENSTSALLIDTPDLANEASKLAIDARALRESKNVTEFATRVKKFSYRLQFATEDQNELKTALLHLLRLIIENISEVVLDDQVLHAQLAVVLGLINEPLNLRQLDDVERRMKDVIFKQGMLKKQLMDAQNRLKSMLARFVDQLADLSESTSGFHDKIEKCATKISQASDIAQLSDVIGEVLHETRLIQNNAQRSRDELREMRQRVEESEKEVGRLQNELAHASNMVRQDPLTGALNRKGMDEALEREVSRFLRHKSTLCVALLDIDNFKKLNDTYGHQVGDAALIHLANVIRETIRPQDTLARYGGEEFVLLLPDSPLDEAVNALTRLQRELTRKFFMSNNDKMLITFSAGVAEVTVDEPAELALKRADDAMYMAKRAGKNRVVAA